MRTFLVLMLVATVTCLIAAGPVWESKPASQWTEEDARQVLAKSPWAKATRAVITRRLTRGPAKGKWTNGTAPRYRQ
jgi:hypothetical protein